MSNSRAKVLIAASIAATVKSLKMVTNNILRLRITGL